MSIRLERNHHGPVPNSLFLRILRFGGLLSVLVCAVSPASAVSGSISGTVYTVRVHRTGISNNWFSLNNTGSLGRCIKPDGQRVAFYVDDDERGKQIIALVTAAMTAGKQIVVTADDTIAFSGNYCIAQYVDIR